MRTFLQVPWPMVGLCLVGVACSARRTPGHGPAPGRVVYDTRPIDTAAFASDASVRRRVLGMPFGEMASRLGSVSFTARTSMTISRGADDYEQSDTYAVTQDAGGNRHLVLETPVSTWEGYVQGGEVLVRYDKGALRQKSHRDTDVETLCDTAVATVSQMLEQFDGLKFGSGTAERVAGRSATRFAVTAGHKGERGDAEQVPPRWRLPLRPVPRWRETARVLDLTGHVSVDDNTGALLHAELQGRLEVAESEPPATTLKLSLVADALDPGRVGTVRAPKAVAEFHRPPRQRDPLYFFRDQIPLPKAEESGAP